MTIQTPQKFTQEELKEIQSLQNKGKNLIYNMGHLEASLIKIENQKTNLKVEFQSLEKEEIKLAEKFTKKYGKGNLDIETGEFTPTE